MGSIPKNCGGGVIQLYKGVGGKSRVIVTGQIMEGSLAIKMPLDLTLVNNWDPLEDIAWKMDLSV